MLDNNIQNTVSAPIASMTADLNRIKQEGGPVASLAGGYSAILTSGLSSDNHSQIAENIYIGSRVGRNAGENNAYFALRPLEGSPWLGLLSNNKLDDELNTEIAHEHLFFEDELGGNIGYSKNGLFEDSQNNLQKYVITREGFDDSLMREAVGNVVPKPYSLLGFGFCQKYNCQDWAEDVRVEYYRLKNQKN